MSCYKRRYENSDRSLIPEDSKRSKKHDDQVPASSYEEPRSRAAPSKNKVETINMKTGGAYIPPAKLKMMQEKIADKEGIEYQRIAWEALKKSLTGLTNKVNKSNIKEVVCELFRENVIRGRGILVKAIMKAQAMSPTFTHVYAALVAIVNTKFPQISELILKRLIIQFKRSFRRNDKPLCVSSTRFIAHLANQQVAHEVVVLEILTVLLETPTDDSVEVAIAMLKECGMKLTELTSKGVVAIFERLRHLLQEVKLDLRVQYMIEVIMAIRKDKFKDHVAVEEDLDLIEDDDKFTHLITLEEATDPEDILNVFKFDSNYKATEERYRAIEKELLDESGDEESGPSGEDSQSEEDKEEEKSEESQKIIDMTETNLVVLRRNIYLTIQSSLDFEECAHKLLKLELNPGQIVEMCYMILDCCAQLRTYEKFYGLLAQRFCQLNKIYVEPFTDIFKVSYETIHRFETNKLRNVAKFFAHLLYTDAISWLVLSCIKLNEEDTTSSNRIFIKILFQELCEYMGLMKLNNRVKDVTLQEAFEGLFPRDNPRNTRFAINFFTSIGLGGLTDELREHLKSAPKNSNVVPSPPPVVQSSSSHDSPSSSSSNSSSSSSSSSGSSSSSESSESEEEEADSRKFRRRNNNKREVKPKSTQRNKYHQKNRRTLQT